MMPLCTTASSPKLTCGCALASVDAAVRGPAGVADAELRVEALGLRGRFHLARRDRCGARGAVAAAVGAIEHGDAGGVVAAVFEPLQALDQYWTTSRSAIDADDSAHGQELLLENARSLPGRIGRALRAGHRPAVRADSPDARGSVGKSIEFDGIAVGTVPAF